MIALFKFIHIGTISIWAAGLICLPFLFVQRTDLETDDAIERLHGMVRFFYLVILSPTAFLAVASGTALIFLRQTFEVWFLLKLVFVGVMVIIHLLSGYMILKLFDESPRYSRTRSVVVTGGTLTVVTVILALVLGKPGINVDGGGIFTPGRLSEMLMPLLPWS